LTNASDPAVADTREFVGLTTTRATTGSSTAPSATTPTKTTTPKTTTPTKTTPPKGGKPGSRRKSRSPNDLMTLRALIRRLEAEVAELKSETNPPSSPSSSSPRNTNPSSSSSGHPSSSSSGNPSSSNSGNPSSSNSVNPSSSNSGNPSSNNGNGGGGGNSSEILQTTSTQLIVTVDLDASKQSEAKVGERVTVELPAGNTIDGRVSAVSPVAQSSSSSDNGSGNGNDSNNGNSNDNGSGGSSGSTIPVTIMLKGHHPGAGLDQASVSVNFEQARATNVLSAPVTALLATPGGRYAVQEAAAPHAVIPVTTGIFAAGYVQISGRGIHPSLRVTDSQG
jgi:hypothetical protein